MRKGIVCEVIKTFLDKDKNIVREPGFNTPALVEYSEKRATMLIEKGYVKKFEEEKEKGVKNEEAKHGKQTKDKSDTINSDNLQQ